MDKLFDKNYKDYEYNSLLYAKDILNYANEYGLEAEVVTYAIAYAQNHPDASYAECLNYGVSEWIK